MKFNASKKINKTYNSITKLEEWKIYPNNYCPRPSNINWNVFCTKFSLFNWIVAFLIRLVIFLVVVICFTPMSFALQVRETQTWLKGKSLQKVADQVAPLITILFNYMFIPTCIRIGSRFINYELQLDQLLTDLRLLYFFLLINTVIIPITGLASVQLVLEKTTEKMSLKLVKELISSNLPTYSTFFMKYLVSCTFISSSVQIMDLAHIMMNKFYATINSERAISEQELKMKKSLSMNKDSWYFDFGSNIAQHIVIYQIIILFSTIAPFVTLFGSLYFTIKYLIDKYNICYVYPT